MRRAFTLTELLVSIALIGILLALLLPMVNKSRRAAGAIGCASNLRQLAVAFTQYEADWKVWPVSQWMYYEPPNDQMQYRSRWWFDMLSSYVGPTINPDGRNEQAYLTLRQGDSVIRGCSQARDDRRVGPGYAMNPSYANGAPIRSLPNMTLPLAIINPWPPDGMWTRQKDWTRPTEKALVLENLGTDVSVWQQWPWWADPTTPMPTRPHTQYFSPDFTRHGPQTPNPTAPAINTLFADLHVELISARQAHHAITFQPMIP